MIVEFCWSGLTLDLLMLLPASRRGKNIFGTEGLNYSLARTGLTLVIDFHQ
jgi:hypothetical protein